MNNTWITKYATPKQMLIYTYEMLGHARNGEKGPLLEKIWHLKNTTFRNLDFFNEYEQNIDVFALNKMLITTDLEKLLKYSKYMNKYYKEMYYDILNSSITKKSEKVDTLIYVYLIREYYDLNDFENIKKTLNQMKDERLCFLLTEIDLPSDSKVKDFIPGRRFISEILGGHKPNEFDKKEWDERLNAMVKCYEEELEKKKLDK